MGKTSSMSQEPITEQEKAKLKAQVTRAIEILAMSNLTSTASLLRLADVRFDDSVPTACLRLRMDGQQEILLGTEFFRNRSPRFIAGVLFHEILHHVMRHLEQAQFDDPNLSNIVYDAFINRTIQAVDPALTEFARQMYSKEESPECFLRPAAKPTHWVDARYYRLLYAGKLTEDDLYEYLARRHNNETVEVMLVGSHQPSSKNPIEKEQVPDVVGEMLDGIKARRGRGSGQLAGKFSELLERFVRINRIGKDGSVEDAFKLSLLDSIRARLVNNITQEAKRETIMRPFALEGFSRSDAIRVGLGIDPLFWQQPDIITENSPKRGEVAVYVDVSGSVSNYIPWLYGAVLSFQEYLKPEVFLFSNKIVPVPLRKFAEGFVSSTGGTNFNCIAEHLLENRFEKCVIITDGYASMKPELQDQIKKAQVEIHAIITFGGRTQFMENFAHAFYQLPEPA